MLLLLSSFVTTKLRTVQLNSNLTVVFDYLRVFTDFGRVPDQRSRAICE